jgi:hypothetical protein
MNVRCDAVDPFFFFIKWEADEGAFGLFEPDPSSVPGCAGIFTPAGQKILGDDLGFAVSVDPDGIATVTVGPECTVLAGVVKGGQLCNLIPETPIILPFVVGCPT